MNCKICIIQMDKGTPNTNPQPKWWLMADNYQKEDAVSTARPLCPEGQTAEQQVNKMLQKINSVQIEKVRNGYIVRVGNSLQYWGGDISVFTTLDESFTFVRGKFSDV